VTRHSYMGCAKEAVLIGSPKLHGWSGSAPGIHPKCRRQRNHFLVHERLWNQKKECCDAILRD